LFNHFKLYLFKCKNAAGKQPLSKLLACGAEIKRDTTKIVSHLYNSSIHERLINKRLRRKRLKTLTPEDAGSAKNTGIIPFFN